MVMSGKILSWEDGIAFLYAAIMAVTGVDYSLIFLSAMAWEELQPYLAAERIERANIRAAHAHEMLNYPADILRPVQGDLLFECQVPIIGDKASLYVPLILAHSAINVVNRLVDSMKVQKSDLRVNTVLARLQREIKARRRQVG
jgi:hypothetical protein